MIETPSLVDQYCHGVLRTELGLGTFEAQLARTEGPPPPAPPSSTPRPDSPYDDGARPSSVWSRTARPPAISPGAVNSAVLEAGPQAAARQRHHDVSDRHGPARRPHRPRRDGDGRSGRTRGRSSAWNSLAEQVADTSGTVESASSPTSPSRCTAPRPARWPSPPWRAYGTVSRSRRNRPARVRCGARRAAGWPDGESAER
ncbi:hypothetical protein ACRAWF_09425 [Streptomyces sp. L7]